MPCPEPLTRLGLRRKFRFTLISRRGGVVVYTRLASTFLHSCRKSIAPPQLIVADALVDAELRGGVGIVDLVIDG